MATVVRFVPPGDVPVGYPQPLRDSRGDEERVEALAVVEVPQSPRGGSPECSRMTTGSKDPVFDRARRERAVGKIERGAETLRGLEWYNHLSRHMASLWFEALINGDRISPRMRKAKRRAITLASQ